MDFQSLNPWNVLMNFYSGNFLPIASKQKRVSILWNAYALISWIIEVIYIFVCFAGMLSVPVDKALRDSTVNIAVIAEVIVVGIHMHAHRALLRRMIEKLNVLLVEDETLRDVIGKTARPLEKPMRIYSVASVVSVVIWTLMPLIKLLRKDEFVVADFRIPVFVGKAIFPGGLFVCGTLIQATGSGTTIFKKTALDIYIIHMIVLLTGEYRYLRLKLAMTFRSEMNFGECGGSATRDRNIVQANEEKRDVTRELDVLARRHGILVQLTAMLKSVLSLNIGVLYVSAVVRFCFLGVMFIMITTIDVEACLIVLYTVGALTQLYILCYSIQQLFEASVKLTDDAFHEEWYAQTVSVQRSFAIMILSNKLECRVSSLSKVDLTLPSFMSIMNQAYSICLLFIKMK